MAEGEVEVFVAKVSRQLIVAGPGGKWATEQQSMKHLCEDLLEEAVDRRHNRREVIEELESFKRLRDMKDVFLPVTVIRNDAQTDERTASAETTRGASTRTIEERTERIAGDPSSADYGISLEEAKRRAGG